MEEHKFKVKYIAKDGVPCSFVFKSDRKMCVKTCGGEAFGEPWKDDAKKAILDVLRDEGSAMRIHGGVRRWTVVLDMTTGKYVHVTG